MPAEELEIGRWFRQVVNADTTLMGLINNTGAWSEVIPNNVELPAVRYTYVAGNDLMVVNGTRILTQATYRVVVVARGPSPAPIVAAVARLDQILHRASGATAALQVLSCVRREPFRFTEVQDQEVYTHAGGVYVVQAQAI